MPSVSFAIFHKVPLGPIDIKIKLYKHVFVAIEKLDLLITLFICAAFSVFVFFKSSFAGVPFVLFFSVFRRMGRGKSGAIIG